jgi:hypothetical protein
MTITHLSMEIINYFFQQLIDTVTSALFLVEKRKTLYNNRYSKNISNICGWIYIQFIIITV